MPKRSVRVDFQERGDLRGAASAYCGLGDAAASQGQFLEAYGYHQDGLRLLLELDDAAAVAYVLADLGNVACEAGDYKGADAYYRDSLRKAVEAAQRTHIARALEEMAKCALTQSRHERALMLSGSASAILRSVGASSGNRYRQTFHEILEQSRLTTDPSAYARILAKSGYLTLGRTLEYALASDKFRRHRTAAVRK